MAGALQRRFCAWIPFHSVKRVQPAGILKITYLHCWRRGHSCSAAGSLASGFLAHCPTNGPDHGTHTLPLSLLRLNHLEEGRRDASGAACQGASRSGCDRAWASSSPALVAARSSCGGSEGFAPLLSRAVLLTCLWLTRARVGLCACVSLCVCVLCIGCGNAGKGRRVFPFVGAKYNRRRIHSPPFPFVATSNRGAKGRFPFPPILPHFSSSLPTQAAGFRWFPPPAREGSVLGGSAGTKTHGWVEEETLILSQELQSAETKAQEEKSLAQLLLANPPLSWGRRPAANYMDY